MREMMVRSAIVGVGNIIKDTIACRDINIEVGILEKPAQFQEKLLAEIQAGRCKQFITGRTVWRSFVPNGTWSQVSCLRETKDYPAQCYWAPDNAVSFPERYSEAQMEEYKVLVLTPMQRTMIMSDENCFLLDKLGEKDCSLVDDNEGPEVLRMRRKLGQ